MASHRGRAERREYRVSEPRQHPQGFTEYRVSEPRQHPQGFTEYRVTARIISKKTAAVKEVTVFKRYSDFKKLHSELSYIHRNLFRKLEEFPAFPKAQVFGRFDEAVIEERRRCAEEMLQFTVDIPALCNSPQLKDFFKDGEACWPLELAAPKDASALPEPLIPLPSGSGETPGSWPQPSAVGPESGEWSEAPTEVVETSPRTLPCLDEPGSGWMAEDGARSPFDSGNEADDNERTPKARSSLPDSELALFDPCAKQEIVPDCARQSNLEALSVPGSQAEELSDPEDLEGRLSTLRVSPDGQRPPVAVGSGVEGSEGTDYLSAAAECIKEALEREAAGEYGLAFGCYRSGVDILLRGLQGEPSVERQDAIKKRIAEYLNHAEAIFALHLKDTVTKEATPPS
ncbi:sorting nexin-15 isoform X4 [Pristis pectinata]|uniref:sorting nexin-15 isoform X3 n=1 Tax=Pristis pectinata TaxID=685728 RepID=UPI00223D1350|nr:sorting nexin-15 isoform X3 [Pristis pectinata]XP_051901145.1 sorting nexin-15 isoform X4 [Pristis pectinata]